MHASQSSRPARRVLVVRHDVRKQSATELSAASSRGSSTGRVRTPRRNVARCAEARTRELPVAPTSNARRRVCAALGLRGGPVEAWKSAARTQRRIAVCSPWIARWNQKAPSAVDPSSAFCYRGLCPAQSIALSRHVYATVGASRRPIRNCEDARLAVSAMIALGSTSQSSRAAAEPPRQLAPCAPHGHLGPGESRRPGSSYKRPRMATAHRQPVL